jgi:hypothetical protein
MTVLLQELKDVGQLPVVCKLYLVHKAGADNACVGGVDACDSLLVLS